MGARYMLEDGTYLLATTEDGKVWCAQYSAATDEIEIEEEPQWNPHWDLYWSGPVVSFRVLSPLKESWSQFFARLFDRAFPKDSFWDEIDEVKFQAWVRSQHQGNLQ